MHHEYQIYMVSVNVDKVRLLIQLPWGGYLKDETETEVNTLSKSRSWRTYECPAII